MAGGKQSARQKMINLMYLVFISMLAMNMDKKVLSSFGFMNESYLDANKSAKKSLDANLESLQMNADDKPEIWKEKNKRAKVIAKLSNDFYKYVESIKDSLQRGVEDKTNYESMDGSGPVDELFFTKEGLKEKGEEFLTNLNNYREAMIKEANSLSKDFPAMKPVLDKTAKGLAKRFSTADEKSKDGKHDVPWMESRFEGMPMVSALANLSKMQSDIRTSEAEIIDEMVGSSLKKGAAIGNNYKAIVAFEKSAYYPGETLKGRIVLGRYDASMVPSDVIVNGKSIKDKVEDGQVILDGIAVGGVGDHVLKGEFIYKEDGKDVPIPIETKYSVIPKPNSPVISADKMNVVYRGVANPITVSFPGIPDNKISASAPGMTRKSGTSYVIRPRSGKTVKISATGKLPSGVNVSGSKTFRIKDIPNPVGTIRRESGVVSMPKSSLAKSTIGAELQDFDFDLKLRVKSFSFRVPGKPTVRVSGSKLNGAAKSALSRAKAGQTVMIFNIKAGIVGNSSYQLKKVAPVTITLK